MQDLDTKVCDKVGQLLGVMPGLHNSCKHRDLRGELTLPLEPSSTEVPPAEAHLASALKREKSANLKVWRRLQVSRRHLARMEKELGQWKDEHSSIQREAEALRSALANGMCLLPTEFLHGASPFLLLTVFAALTLWLGARRCLHGGSQKENQLTSIHRQLYDKTSDLLEKIRHASIIDAEQSSDTVRTGDRDCSDVLDTDFSFCVFDERVGQETLRYVKIKCPGVEHNDIVVDVIGNGCVVTIDRKPSQGVDAAEWVRNFTFSISDGLFNLRDDQVRLDGGFLTLAFRAVRSRIFRFPRHFDMSATDDGDAWLHCDDFAPGHCTEATLLRASQALRMAAATDVMCKVSILSDTCNACAISTRTSSSCDSNDFEHITER